MCLFVCLMVFNATFNTISVISWRSVLLLGGNQRNWRKQLTCRKSLTNFIIQCCTSRLIEIRTHNISGDRH